MKLVWSPRAVAQATEIARYIAADRPGAAAAWVDALFARAARITDYPQAGRRVPELPKRRDLREVLVGTYRVIYRVEATRVVLLTVRHGARRFDPDVLE